MFDTHTKNIYYSIILSGHTKAPRSSSRVCKGQLRRSFGRELVDHKFPFLVVGLYFNSLQA